MSEKPNLGWAPASVGGAILQGGRSSRMGRDKAFVVVDGVAMRDRVEAALDEFCGAGVVFVGGDGADVTDDGGSAFAGVVAVVEASVAEVVVVCAVDMPLVDASVIARLLAAAEHDDVCFVDHPLPLVVHASSRARLRALYDAGERKLSRCATAFVDVDDAVAARLLNVNTPADVAVAEAALRAAGSR